ncbi:uncharacterized protein LOC111068415 [Drosophila obscura]|uniref:uncharacterized protein LOC111068415 n=1 Tax=Drosophila obscura TaxID=7282 RepID=UPI001BB20BC3|nr:uncharacterized protein LOC111068415 [Drosophila obscura]
MAALESGRETLCCFFYCIGIFAISLTISFSAAIWNAFKRVGKYFISMKTRSQAVHKQLRPPDDANKRLRHYLINGPNRSNICDKVVVAMEEVNIVPLLVGSSMGDEKLRNILHVLALRLRCLRLQMAEIPKLHDVCQRMEVPELTRVRACIVLAGVNGSSVSGGSQLELLGSLTPGVEMLKVFCRIDGHFPVLKKVRVIQLNCTVAQATLEELFCNCPMLRHLELRDESRPPNTLDMRSIGQCSFLEALMLPLLLKSPLAICQLGNLKKLSLQSKDPWQDEDWLLTVQQIIQAKRYELEGICLDGTYLGAPLNLSVLLLARCTALTEVRLSHCELVEDSNLPLPLPFSCRRLRIRSCTLNKVSLLLESDPMLQQIEFFNCKFAHMTNILAQALAKRRTQPILGPLQIKLLQSPKMRLEYNSWSRKEQLAAKPWLEVEVLKKAHIPFLEDQPPGMISMRFGRAINSLPTFLHHQNLPDNADLLKEMSSLDLGSNLPIQAPETDPLDLGSHLTSLPPETDPLDLGSDLASLPPETDPLDLGSDAPSD